MPYPFGVHSDVLTTTFEALRQAHGPRITDPASIAMIHQALSQAEDVWINMAMGEPAPLAIAEQAAA